MHQIACLLGDWVWACQFKLAMLVSENVTLLLYYKLDAYNKYSPLIEKWGGSQPEKELEKNFQTLERAFSPPSKNYCGSKQKVIY